jgi:WD40 repeat protein
VTSVSFSPCGGRIASASRDSTIKVWEASTGTCQSTLNGHDDLLRSVCFSPDGRHIASGSDDKTVKIWNASTGKLQSTRGHRYDPFPCIECLLL